MRRLFVAEARENEEHGSPHPAGGIAQFCRRGGDLDGVVDLHHCGEIAARPVGGHDDAALVARPARAQLTSDECLEGLAPRYDAALHQTFEPPRKRNGATRKEAVAILEQRQLCGEFRHGCNASTLPEAVRGAMR